MKFVNGKGLLTFCCSDRNNCSEGMDVAEREEFRFELRVLFYMEET